MKRVSRQALLTLAEAMPEREREITETVARLRLVAGSQLARLFPDKSGKAASRERSSRRKLNKLCEEHVLTRLERRIGGVRAGSAGHVYALGPIGKRLDAFWQGEGLIRVRAVYEPGAPFVRHTLAIAEQYVRLVETERAGGCDLLAFESEPTCWRACPSAQGGLVTLKPDAFLRLGVGEFEQRSFLEVDLGSEGRGALARKCRAYVSYFQSGQEQADSGVFPRVVWLTISQARVRLLTDVCAELPAEYWQLFVVGTFERLIPLVTGRGDPKEMP